MQNILTLLLVLTLNQKTKIPDMYVVATLLCYIHVYRYMITFGVCSEAAALIWFLGFYGGGHTTSKRNIHPVFD